MKRSLSVIVLALLTPVLAAAQHIGPFAPKQPHAADDLAAKAATAAAPRVAETFGVAPLATLGAAAVEAPARIEAMRAWNEGHHRPLRNGFARPLAAPRAVDLTGGLPAAIAANRASAAKSTSGAADSESTTVAARDGGMLVQTSLTKVAWGGTVHVADAHRLRLHLSQVELPEGAQLWVHGAGASVGPFGKELIAGGGLWTPSVPGEDVSVDVELPAAALAGKAHVGFTVDKVLELMEIGTADPKDDSCGVDAACKSSSDFPAIENVRHAVAQIEFVDPSDPGFGGQCTGQLLNDSRSSGTPYMLTANHCVSTQEAAASLQAWWDDYDSGCNVGAPNLDTLPQSNGATLLATGNADTSSDYTLMLLNSIPSGRILLGWDANAADVPQGTLLYRLSHGNGAPQEFNVTKVDTTVEQCPPNVRPRFLYSDTVVGGTFGGSSGSAAMLANGSVVGQLYGGCGVDDDCSPLQFTVDGAFSNSFPALQQYLAPSSTGVCRPDRQTLCLLSRRFKVQVSWQNQFNSTAGTGFAIPSTDSSGYFYFTDASNYELVFKILNFGSVLKVFYGELTDLNFTITVTDTSDGTTKTYQNTPGDCGAIDEDAFAADDSTKVGVKSSSHGAAFPTGAALAAAGLDPKAGTCRANATTLCLQSKRFAITVNWMNQFNNTSGTGAPKSLSDQSGLFTFTDPTVVELVMKTVEFTDRVAFFYSALSDFEYDITVTDTVGGTVKTYHNPPGTYCGGLDNSAFPP